MPKKIYYSRKVVNATRIRFFDVALADAPGREHDTNMISPSEFPADFTIRRIKVAFGCDLSVAELTRMITDSIIAFRAGDRAFEYYPVLLCLVDNIGGLVGAAGTAEGRIIGSAVDSGLTIEPYLIPKGVKFEFFIQTLTTPAFGKVTVMLEGDIAV